MAGVLRILVVDDEPIAREILCQELSTFPGVEMVGEAENGETALRKIRAEKPDLVLLDLQMPAMGGLEVVSRLKQGAVLPAVVIVTAWDQHAVQAFEAGAIDYLLKPVSRERLEEAIERARRFSGRETAERLARLQEIPDPASAPPDRPARRIVGRLGSEYILLSADEVFAFQSEGDLVWIVTARTKLLATQTLKALEERLSHTSFCRIHRNALVNLDQVRKMSVLSSQRWLVTLSNKMEFVVSKRQAKTIRRLLNL